VRTTKSFSITVPTKLAAEIDRAAAAQCRSRSSLLAWLIRQAAKQEIHEGEDDPEFEDGDAALD
jgi:metal-responsive CopG/Arc/MetJ family transcriptional regulator